MKTIRSEAMELTSVKDSSRTATCVNGNRRRGANPSRWIYQGIVPLLLAAAAASMGVGRCQRDHGREGYRLRTAAAATVTAGEKSNWRVLWRFDDGAPLTQSGIIFPPVPGPGRFLYVSADDNRVYALDRSTGKPIWSFRAGDQIAGSPVISAGMVYISSADGYMYALNGASGKLRWKFHAGEVGTAPVIGSGGDIAVGTVPGEVYSVNRLTGQLHWKVRLPGAIILGALASAPHRGNFLTAGDTLYRLSAATGRVLWKTRLGDSLGVRLGPVDALYAIRTPRNRHCSLSAISQGSGKVLWRHDFTPAFPFPWNTAASAGAVYIVGSQPTARSRTGTARDGAKPAFPTRYLDKLDARDGHEVWHTPGIDHVGDCRNGVLYCSGDSNDAAGKEVYSLLTVDITTGKARALLSWKGSLATAPVVNAQGKVRMLHAWNTALSTAPVVDGQGIVYAGGGFADVVAFSNHRVRH